MSGLADAAVSKNLWRGPMIARLAPIWVGFGAMALPTFYALGQQVWTREAGAHGPIVLTVGAWLLGRQWKRAAQVSSPGSVTLTSLFLGLSLPLYAFGRAFDFISLEAAGLYFTGIAIIYSLLGSFAIRRLWFPISYLAFLLPPPGWFMDTLTAPLKQFVSSAAMSILSIFGVPVGREGVTIYVAQYRLLVEDACSGMNSLIGLVAVSLLYVYLMRGTSLRYSAALMVFAIPIAIIGNIVRIMTLILLTYWFGDEVAQGFLHETAGIFLFAIDLMLVFLVDRLLLSAVPPSWRPQ